MGDLLLAIDAGTTSVRAIAFDCSGRKVATHAIAIGQRNPRPAWVEQDAAEIIQASSAAVLAVLARVGRERVIAIGIANQRETTIFWDAASGKPLAPAIVWQDRRGAELCAMMVAAGDESSVQARTGLVLDAYFSASKIAWALKNYGYSRYGLDSQLGFVYISCMNLMTIFARFPDQEACIEYLEKVRWATNPSCPYCGSVAVARKTDSGRVGRWNCHGCKSSFNVLARTIFEKTRVPLQKWFLAIGLVVNAKKSLSSCQLSRDLDLNQKTAWYVQQRIRAAMMTEEGELLQGIVEADETYVGGKPRKGNRRDGGTPNKRGRGTAKTAVLGVVERGGRVAAKVASDLTGNGILRFLTANVDPATSLLITDEYRAYNAASGFNRAVVNHSQRYADGDTHTNTIESFWALVKRAWYGTHHHYTKRYMPLFIAESCWKYNRRKNPDAFGSFMRGCFA